MFAATAFGQTSFLWHEPSKIDFGTPPKAPFVFEKEDLSGTQPKIFVHDASGAAWNVKFGYEVKNESFCWRLVRACGYFAEPSFFVAQGQIQGLQPMKRTTPSLHPDGNFTDARFQYRDPNLHFLKDRNWRWDRPPLAGTRELNGLKMLIMLFSNWDNKDARVGKGGPNTAIFEEGGKQIYAFTDWGSGMGRWGSVPGSDSNWNCADFTAQTPQFVKGVVRGRVEFGWEGDINGGFRTGIPAAHAAWLMQYLGRVTDTELHDWLKAAGANDAEAGCFTQALRARIGQLGKIR